MSNKPKQIIIIGGGDSIREGIDLGLWDKLKDKYVAGINYSYKYFLNSTFQSYVDENFYNDEYDNLKKLSLIIGKEYKFKNPLLPNTILLKDSNDYYRNVKQGCYKANLAGLFTLSIAIYILNKGDEIYLLGYDFGERRTEKFEDENLSVQEINRVTIRDDKKRPLTHFYQEEINHRGIGHTSYYNSTKRAENDFKPYEKEKNVKIYNVSLISKIKTFPKISYEEFFKKLNDTEYNQEELRKSIRKKLKLGD